jgi:hypothetical protein
MEVTINQTVEEYIVEVNESTSQILVNITNEPKQVDVVISQLGERGFPGKSNYEIAVDNGFVGTEQQWLDSLNVQLYKKTSGEAIPSYTPVAIVNNLAYKLDCSNNNHQFSFVGFSVNGTNIGEECHIQQIGEVSLIGWGLIPNQHYLSGVSGSLITENLSPSNFTKIIGYATSSNTLQIIKDSTTINRL